MKTTNYYNTFIEIAEDSPAQKAELPPLKGDKKTVANLQFDLLYDHPYAFTSDDILFRVHAIKQNIASGEMESEREKFFSKGQPCFRSSPLTKRYGWGIHSNAEGRIALVASGSEEYRKLQSSADLKVIKAMRSKKA